MTFSVKSLHFQLLVKITETSATKAQIFPSRCPLLKNRGGSLTQIIQLFEKKKTTNPKQPHSWRERMGAISLAEGRDAEAGCAAGEGGRALRLRGMGQVSAASQRGHERGEQAAGAGRVVSPLPAPCETVGNGVIAYSSCACGTGL